MHNSSIQHVIRMRDSYVRHSSSLTTLDIGSYSSTGGYRSIFNGNVGWTYTGVDIRPGPNVDVIMEEAYKIPFPDAYADVIVCGQTFEHVEFFWQLWLEMSRVVKPDGYIFLVTPSTGPIHRYPVDCWRINPDGYAALAKYGGMSMVEVIRGDNVWGDCAGVFSKGVGFKELEERAKGLSRRALRTHFELMRRSTLISKLLYNVCPGAMLRGAEVGVWVGSFLFYLLKISPRMDVVYAIDPYSTQFKSMGEFTQERWDAIFTEAKNRLHEFPVEWIRATSNEAAKKLVDGSLHFVHIDGNHSEEQVFKDITNYEQKLMRGGLICGHDWYLKKPQVGIKSAVEKFLVHNNRKLEVDSAAATWWWYV